jgi:hypothetical protein
MPKNSREINIVDRKEKIRAKYVSIIAVVQTPLGGLSRVLLGLNNRN